jgi:hypothetical protein
VIVFPVGGRVDDCLGCVGRLVTLDVGMGSALRVRRLSTIRTIGRRLSSTGCEGMYAC